MILEFIIALGGAYLLAKGLEKRQIRESGQRLREDLDSAFSAGHEFVSVQAAEFERALDLPFYTRVQHQLEQEGFGWVDDIEDLTLSRKFPPNRTFQRLMVTDDGKARASIYHLRPAGKMYRFLAFFHIVPKDYYTIELATEFSGGFTLITNNTKGFPVLDMPEQLDIMATNPETPISEIVHIHMGRVERFQEANPHEQFHPGKGRDDLLSAMERILIMCQRFRAERGYSMDELQRVGSKLGSKSALKELHKELNKEG